MDFIRVGIKEMKDGTRSFYPSLQALESSDLVIRGGQFVAVWDEEKKLFSRNKAHLATIVDRSFAKMVGDRLRPGDSIMRMQVYDNGVLNRMMGLIGNVGDMGPELDQKIIFADQIPTKEDAATFKMSYALSETESPAWDKLVGTLYSPEERLKIEWAIGSIFSGDAATRIQKFYVFFGPPGSGKSTIMDIIESLFDGHTASFSAQEMGRRDAQFSLEPFSKNPLVGIDQDGDLSRIEVNVNLNSIVSHDRLLINSKGRNLFKIQPRTTLFIGTNEPVKISDRKSGIFRRLVDIQPTGALIPEEQYHALVSQVQFELGAIAAHCIKTYHTYGSAYLSGYRSNDMMYRTNDIFNFVQDNRLVLSQGITLKQAHKMYTEWCLDTDTKNVYKQYVFRDKLMDYFKEFHAERMIDGTRYRSYFEGLRELDKFTWQGLMPKPKRTWLEMDETVSLWDNIMHDQPAQLSTGNPDFPLRLGWDAVKTKLREIDTTTEHYVQVPKQHIVIDFDLEDADGKKNLELCLEEAAKWPETYAEISRSGHGLHLHYDTELDVEKLANADPGGKYEVKTLLGNASLRRKLSLCNKIPVATISSGLPMKEEKVLAEKTIKSERGLRELVLKALRKQVHPYTKSNMDFIEHVLVEAYNSDLTYDISDMWEDILDFAMGSHNQKDRCIEIALKLPMKSEEDLVSDPEPDEAPIADFDVEVFPNLFVVCYMLDTVEEEVVALINPTAQECEDLYTTLRLIGYYNRGYDNHILYAASLGYDNQQLYELSQRLVVDNDRRAGFAAAYNLAYADTLDIAAEKKSVKRWEIDLGLKHSELGLPWNEPVPEDLIMKVVDYCKDDVRAQRVIRRHLKGDFNARRILAALSGLQMINTNRQHTEKLIFGDLKDTKDVLVYTDLKETFPGYEFDQFKPGKEKSTYKGYSIGEGGWVDSVPGMYQNVELWDVASMHPTSIVAMNTFGPYTEKFKQLMDIRLLVKAAVSLRRKKLPEEADAKIAQAIEMDPRLGEFLTDPEAEESLAYALKIVINSVYGLTAASFPNRFRDMRNNDNIVAKRGALFMVDLKEFIEANGGKVVHVKTDSVKVINSSPELGQKIMDFGKKYGYDFEHEATYEKFCLVNDAVYVARKDGVWSATGKQFQHPVVFKTLFSHEEIVAGDYVEVKQVQKGAMYLRDEITEHDSFVGKFGAFVPVLGGRNLLRLDGDREFAVAGTKGYLWETAEVATDQNLDVDTSYFQALIDEATANIEKFGSYQELVA